MTDVSNEELEALYLEGGDRAVYDLGVAHGRALTLTPEVLERAGRALLAIANDPSRVSALSPWDVQALTAGDVRAVLLAVGFVEP